MTRGNKSGSTRGGRACARMKSARITSHSSSRADLDSPRDLITPDLAFDFFLLFLLYFILFSGFLHVDPLASGP